MQQAAFIDIFTTQNDLYGKNNCPIQFCCEFVSDDDMNDVEHPEKFMNPSRRKVFNIIPDEPIMMSGYNASGFKTEDTKTSDYNGFTLDVSLTAIKKILSAVENRNIFLVGYNHLNYDIKIINEHFLRVLGLEPCVFNDRFVIDVMRFAEASIPVCEIGNYAMDSAFTYLVGSPPRLNALRQNRSTITELRLTKMIMLSLVKRLGKKLSFSDIVEFIDEQEKKQDTFTFGKYKGMKYSEVYNIDIGYLSWIVGNKELNKTKPYLVGNVKKLLAEVV